MLSNHRDIYGGQGFGGYDISSNQFDPGQGTSTINYQTYGQMQQNTNMFSPAVMEEPPTPGSTRGRQTRSSRGGRGGGMAATTPMGKRGAAAAAAVAIAQRAVSSPEGDTPVPTPSPAPRRRGRPKKNQATDYTPVEDESTLFSIIKNGKSSLQVWIQIS